MSAARHFTARPDGRGRYLVVYPLAGCPGQYAAAGDYPTLRAAEREADWLEAERARQVRQPLPAALPARAALDELAAIDQEIGL